MYDGSGETCLFAIIINKSEITCIEIICVFLVISESEQIKATLKKGLGSSKPVLPPIKADSTEGHDKKR